ncbi:hypothetical protein [Legionella nagasakiensis]|uniref:hypothetical protein n=1 Tax=Legionella nagasakiensis TaxID=535290 RepID=UPI001054E84D|nr:hypothetical protein [Legionella nagasakiensis]
MGFIRISFISVLSFLLLSCASNYGAIQLPPDRISYNASLQYSDTQQMLINIVRLRYTDIPYFLTVNNVVSQFNYSRHAGAGFTNDPGSTSLTVGVDGDVSLDISESPTITYTPYQGENYVTKLLTPIDLSVAYMLLRAGWGVNAVFRLIFQGFGEYANSTIASRSVTRRVPEYKEFHELGLVFLRLQHNKHLKVSPEKTDGEFGIRLTIEHFNRIPSNDRNVLAKHGFTSSTPSVLLVSHPTNRPGEVYVQTRPVLGVFNYLSKGVDIPEEDIIYKRAPMTYQKNGEIFDWRKITRGQMSVHTSKLKPSESYVAVKYKKNWFYIAEDDFDSKETLNMLSIIMGIYQGDVQSFLPVLTVS